MRKLPLFLTVMSTALMVTACGPQDSASADFAASNVPAEQGRDPVPATPAPAPVAQTPAPVVQAPQVCTSCGVVRSVTAITQQGQSTGAGAVIGALVGGAAGNQIGGGSGRKIATAAGAIGGALLGNNIEQNRRASVYYEVRIDMEDGSQQIINLDDATGVAAGTPVSVVNGNIMLR
ncbi:MAG TPA: glycine zipper 2TM domain-containing protein [Pseudohongiella sp.]|nr:glycine zipper 2TM domain-containing protein [Pseudohongiella sp.]